MDEATFHDSHGVDVFFRHWPRPDATGVVVIAHGASEHSGRYDRFARALNDAGFAVYAPDHRGQGRTAPATGTGRMGPGGGQAVIDDLHELVGIAQREYPGRPIVAFGHSLGATMTLPYAVRYADELAGAVLCGFPAPVADVAALAAVFQAAVDAGQRDEPVDVLGGFNAAFEPARTPYDWLSRDPNEVDKYIADPLCGDDLPLTYGYFVDLFDVAGPAASPEALARIAAPVMVIAGACDPAAGMGAFAEALATALEQAGVSVRSKIYPDARHELLNETNRDEVTADVIAFITEVTKA